MSILTNDLNSTKNAQEQDTRNPTTTILYLKQIEENHNKEHNDIFIIGNKSKTDCTTTQIGQFNKRIHWGR